MSAFRPQTPTWPWLVALLAGLFACKPLPFPEPDPDEVLPPASCEEDVVLGLTRTRADSELSDPTWLQVCTLCPADQLRLSLVDESATLVPVVSGWADGGRCAVSMPTGPLLRDLPLSVQVELLDGERSAFWSFAAEAIPAATDPPLDLGSGTYLASGGMSSLRLPYPNGETEPELLELPAPDLLVHISEPNKNGNRDVRLGEAEDGIQDLCVPTQQLQDAGLSFAGDVWGSLGEGSSFPTPLGGLLRRGAITAQLSDDGSSLVGLSVLAVIDLAAMTPQTGLSALEACAQWQEQLGSDPCVPCGDPAVGAEGSADCITTVSEWPIALRTEASLQPVSIEALSSDCAPP